MRYKNLIFLLLFISTFALGFTPRVFYQSGENIYTENASSVLNLESSITGTATISELFLTGITEVATQSLALSIVDNKVVLSPVATGEGGGGASAHGDLTGVLQATTGVTEGHVNDQAQTIAGAKTFSSTLTATAGLNINGLLGFRTDSDYIQNISIVSDNVTSVGITNGDRNVVIGGYDANIALAGVSDTVFLGNRVGRNTTAGNKGVYIGALSGGNSSDVKTGQVGIGYGSMLSMAGNYNSCVGMQCMYTHIDGAYNTCVGAFCFQNDSDNSSRKIGIGTYAGINVKTTGALVVDSYTRASEALSQSQSIVYGIMATLPENQTLTLNAATTINNSLYSPTITATTLTVNGNATVTGTATINGDTTFNNDVTISDALNVNGTTIMEYVTARKLIGKNPDVLEIFNNDYADYNQWDTFSLMWAVFDRATSTALHGSADYVFVNFTDALGEYVCTPEVSIPVWARGNNLGVKFIYSYSGDTGDITATLYDTTNTINLGTQDIQATDGARMMWSADMLFNTAYVKICFAIAVENDAEVLHIDDIEFSSNSYGITPLVDGVTEPATASYANIYIDSADGDLKIKFSDGVIKTITTDTP